jgi:DUF1365 family protein
MIANSCIYTANIIHARSEPIKRRFAYKVFMFYLDLDELDKIQKSIWLIGRNKFNYFNFRDKDHIQLSAEGAKKTRTTKEHLIEYLKQNNVNQPIGRVMILTNLATLGYQFNPVSFYFIYDSEDKPFCSVVEVGNTFGEMKPFYIDNTYLEEKAFKYQTKKLFYVSPFIAHDVDFGFDLEIPAEKLKLKIDDYKDGHKFFSAVLTGERKTLSNRNVVMYALFFPIITLKVIGLIHWQAFKIWMKGIRYFRKSEFPELQVGVYNKKY